MIQLFALIVVQVICFQFLMHFLIRLLPDQLLGRKGHPQPVAAELAAFRNGQGRLARIAGVLLLIAALLVTFVPPMGDEGNRKLGLAAISLASSLIMLLGYISDAKRIIAIGKQLPKSDMRSAGLTPRGLGEVYPVALELLPPALFLATLLGALARGADIFAAPLLPIFLCQLGFVVASHYFARWLAAQRPVMLPEALALQENGSDSIAEGLRFRHQDLRYFLAARIVIVLLLGFMQAQQIAEQSGEALPSWLAMGDNILVILLLVVFAIQLLQLSRWSRGGRSPKNEARAD